MWFVLALGSAVFFAAQGAAAKSLGDEYPTDVVTWFAFIFSLPIYMVVLAYDGIPVVQPEFWGWAALSVGLNCVAIPMYFSALRHGELSVVLPLSTLTPLFALGTEYVLLGEVPGSESFAGVLLIVLGAYLLHAGDLKKGLIAPILTLSRDRGARRMLLAGALWSITAVADRGAVLASSPAFYVNIFGGSFSVAFFFWLLGKRREYVRKFIKDPWRPAGVGVFGAAMALCQMAALAYATASVVTAVKRLAALFGVILGNALFKEGHVWARLLAAGIMVAGALVLALGF